MRNPKTPDLAHLLDGLEEQMLEEEFGAMPHNDIAAELTDQYVSGHTRSDGTYVQGYYRSSPNAARYDNYSSQGNANPYTGKAGTERNEQSAKPEWNDSYGNGSGKHLNSLFGDD